MEPRGAGRRGRETRHVRADIERWDRRYAERDVHAEAEPDPWLAGLAPRLDPPRPGALALDVACGAGANAVLLAGRGYDVIGLDASVAGLRLAQAAALRAGARLRLAALDLDRWRPPPARFSVVIAFRFLHRALFPRLAESLEPGGILVCRTFNLGRLRGVPGFNPDYLVAPGELGELFDGLDIIEIDDGDGDCDTSRLLARMPADGPRPR